MNEDELKKLILKICESTIPSARGCRLKCLKNFLIQKTSFLNRLHTNLTSRAWFIIKNKTEPFKCLTCGEILKNQTVNFDSGKHIRFCSAKCENQHPVTLKKLRETNLKKFNCDWSFQSAEVKSKARKTMNALYGVNYSLENKILNKNFKLKMIAKYGSSSALRNKDLSNKMLKSRRSTEYKKFLINEYVLPLFSEEQYLKFGNDYNYSWCCKKCGNVFKSFKNVSWFKQGSVKAYARCENCFPFENKISYLENDIFNFLKLNYKNEILKNVRNIISPLELDIYIPDKKLAIEFDGLYWHSTRQKIDKNYHLKKTEACKKQNIQLIHIFENEWVLKQDIVKGYLNKLLDNFSKNINSDECEVKEIDSKITEEFLIKNYIFDFKISDINIGLYFNDELVSMIQIKKLKDKNFELMSFCDKLNYKVNNSLKKLLNYFEQKFKYRQIISYVDRRWDNGKNLMSLDFKALKNFGPKKLSLSVNENKNFLEIYDCGSEQYCKI